MKSTFLKLSPQKMLHVVVILLYLVFVYLCAPICFAFFLSSIIVPILTKLEQKLRLHYTLLLVICSICMLTFCGGLFYVLLQYGEAFLYTSYYAIRQFLTTLEQIPIVSYAIAPLQQAIIQLIGQIATSFQLFVHYIFDVLLFSIAFYFSLIEGRRDRYWYFVYVPKEYREKWRSFFHDALHMFVRYFSIELRLVMITTIVLSIGFSLLQFPNAIVKAILLAFLDCIPFFGISLVLIPCMLYFSIIGSYTTTIGLFVLLIVTIVVRQLFDTYFWAATVKIKTIHTFFISGVSFMLFGIYGIIVSPILLLVVMKWQLHYGRR